MCIELFHRFYSSKQGTRFKRCVHIIKAISKSAHFTTSLPEGNVIIFANLMVFHLHVAISKIWAPLVAQLVKNPPATWETCV